MYEKDFSSIKERLRVFLMAIKEPDLTNHEQNELYKGIIKSISYTRLEKDNRKIEIQFK